MRRRGKPLVRVPFVDSTDDRNQRCRSRVKRGQPFRSTTNDVSHVSARSNVDFQLLMCAPVEPADVANEPPPSGACQPTQVDSLAPAPSTNRRRLTKKTAGATKTTPAPVYQSGDRKWLYACGLLKPADQAIVESFQVAFQKAFSMDFYITKYQGKMLDSMAPFFQLALAGMQRLEQQEREEQEEEASKLLKEGGDHDGSRSSKSDVRRRRA